jgi:hypothetical protein
VESSASVGRVHYEVVGYQFDFARGNSRIYARLFPDDGDILRASIIFRGWKNA